MAGKIHREKCNVSLARDAFRFYKLPLTLFSAVQMSSLVGIQEVLQNTREKQAGRPMLGAVS